MSYHQPVTEDEDRREPAGAPPVAPRARLSRRNLALIVAGGVLGVVGPALLALAFIGADVPRGTQVAGVDIGGKSEPAAATALRVGLGEKLTAPINARVRDETIKIDPAATGVRLDGPATAGAAATRNPFLRAAAMLGQRDVAPVIQVDQARLAPTLTAHTARLGEAPEPGAVRFQGTTPVAVYPKPGRGLDPERVAAAIVKDWLRRDQVRLTVSSITPPATDTDVDDALEQIARPAVAAPVSVLVAGRTAVVPPTAIASALIIAADAEGEFIPRFDTKKLDVALAELLKPINIAPRDAAFKVVGAAVRIVPSATGRKVDTAALAVDLAAVIVKPAPRTVTGKLIDNVEPKLTTARASALGVKQNIGSFTTYYPCCPARNRNIQIVADEVDGAVVLPGETFSLNGYTGPRTAEQGYIKAPVISGGKLKNEVGGGISQFATTLFNAVFFSGLEDVYHKTHSFYISRYPAGREATVYYSSVDLKFKNDSPYAVLIDTSWTNTSITVAFFSTKRYDITSVSGSRTNHTTFTTQYLGDTPECIATSGINGFNISVTRVFKQAGRVIRNEVFNTVYLPEKRFICSDPPGASPPPPG